MLRKALQLLTRLRVHAKPKSLVKQLGRARIAKMAAEVRAAAHFKKVIMSISRRT